MPGYFKVERDFLESDFWLSEPFTKPQAWVDLFGVANHAPGFFVKRGIQVKLERSQTGRSELTLAKRWKWSRNKVRRFLKWLAKEEMISLKQDNKTSVITICNYEVYQGYKTEDDTPKGTPKGTPERHQKDTKRNTNNNVKNDDKNNKKKTSFPPDPESYKIPDSLLSWSEKKGVDSDQLKNYVETCLIWHGSKGNKYADWTRTIQNWILKDLKDKPTQSPNDYL
jgi:hypothetical protein